MNSKIENTNKKILKLQKEMKDLLVQYTDLVNDNKFHTFLLRIFKKKYKQSQGRNGLPAIFFNYCIFYIIQTSTAYTFSEFPLSSSSSSSESISDEDDAATIDSRELGTLRIDENVLPMGCDEKLYDMAFVLRKQRYMYEFQIREEQKKIEGLCKDRDMVNKKLKLVQHDLKSNHQDLEAFMVN